MEALRKGHSMLGKKQIRNLAGVQIALIEAKVELNDNFANLRSLSKLLSIEYLRYSNKLN